MTVEIKIKNNWVEFFLKKGKKVLDRVKFKQEHSLSEKLLPAIDKLITKNKLKTADVKRIEFNSDVPDSYTTFRIVSAVKEAFNWAIVNS